MIKPFFLFLILVAASVRLSAQAPLPSITVKNINNKIIVSWVNEYIKPITALNIQRSYDSLKNYYTVGSVLSPQSRENGYADINPPYNKMYYRVFVAFEGGSYVITTPARPVKDLSGIGDSRMEMYPWMAGIDSAGKLPNRSLRVFTAKDNNVVIHLPDAAAKKYTVKFFDETEKLLFELTKLKEEYLILEKVNFVHPGWFRFEVYENGELLENNTFQIIKDSPKKL